jgi:hypothetical protein
VSGGQLRNCLLKAENSRLSYGGTKAMSVDEAMTVQKYWTLLRSPHFIHI